MNQPKTREMVHPTQPGQDLTYCFEVTARLKELKEFFFLSFCDIEFSNPEAQLKNFKQNPQNSHRALGLSDKINIFYKEGNVLGAILCSFFLCNRTLSLVA